MSLTPEQERFVAEYLVDLNATAAAERARYEHPNKQGPRMLVNVGIAKAIASAQVKRSERTEITQDYVLAAIKDTIEECRGDEHRNPQAALKGLELLGRHLAMFTDKTENRNIVENLTDEELDEQIAELECEVKASRLTH